MMPLRPSVTTINLNDFIKSPILKMDTPTALPQKMTNTCSLCAHLFWSGRWKGNCRVFVAWPYHFFCESWIIGWRFVCWRQCSATYERFSHSDIYCFSKCFLWSLRRKGDGHVDFYCYRFILRLFTTHFTNKDVTPENFLFKLNLLRLYHYPTLISITCSIKGVK